MASNAQVALEAASRVCQRVEANYNVNPAGLPGETVLVYADKFLAWLDSKG